MQPSRLNVSPIGVLTPDYYCSGAGTESFPFVASDNTAGIQTALDIAADWRGGTVELSIARYDVTALDGIRMASESLVVTSPCPGFNEQPNALSEGLTGQKIRTSTHGLRMGLAANKLGGLQADNLYLWGPAVTGSHDGVTIDNETDQPRLTNLNISNFAKAINITSVCDAGHLTHLNLLGNGYGIFIDTTGNPAYTKVSGCEISDNFNTGIADFSQATNGQSGHTDYLRVENCTLVRNANTLTVNGANIYLGSNSSIVAGCTIRDAGHNLLNNTFVVASGIIAASDFNVISDNIIASHQKGAGLNLVGNWNVVTGNSFGEGNAFDAIVQGIGNQVDAPASPSIIDAGKNSIIRRVASILDADTIAAWQTFMASLSTGHPDPIGESTSIKLIPNTANDFHSAFKVVSSGGPQGSVFTFLAKADGYSWIKPTMQFAAADHGAWVNLADGSTGTVDSGMIVQVFPLASSGWYAVLLFCTSASTVLGINVGNANNATQWTGDGTSGVLIWRPYVANTERQ